GPACWSIARGRRTARELARVRLFFRVLSRRPAYRVRMVKRRGILRLAHRRSGGCDAPGVAYPNEQAGFVPPCAWIPDGRQVLTLLFRRDNISQIALIPADGGPPRVLRSLNWVYPKKMDVSPDGRWIVYDNFAAEGHPERTIFILSVDGSEERRLVDTPGNYLFPMWSPNGRRVYFAGDRGDEPKLWWVDVDNGKPTGAPLLASGALGRSLPLGITQAGDFFFGVRTGVPDVYTLDGAGKPQRVASKYAGRNWSPAWSRDGKQLA